MDVPPHHSWNVTPEEAIRIQEGLRGRLRLRPSRTGNTAPLVEEGRTIGMVVRTRAGVKPVYVSPGHRMDLETSVKTVLSLCRGYRVPEPLRQAHLSVNRLRKGE